MPVGTKVTLVVIVLFGAVLAFYYGLGTPSATLNQGIGAPNPNALMPPIPAPNDEQDSRNARPRFENMHNDSNGMLGESVKRAIDALPGRSNDGRRTTDGRSELLTENAPPRAVRLPTNDPPDERPAESEIPANDPLARSTAPARTIGDTPPIHATPPPTVPYTVKKDDSLWTIAEDWFGDATRWDQIAKANPLIDPDRLKLGQVIRLPAKDAVRRSIRPARTTPTKPGAYVVKSGDSLSRIARIHYGDESKWSIIYAANRSTIGPDPAELQIGMRLRIPPPKRSVGS